eukprot:CAMPEP_0197315892 /NCGR_PEP_ID=MMETSP0891-20130614/39710_1 /TAXON_ID=44058 ORGANISM="Aureoumbra lagunensis, Strain CCMP1510" /NCGR_SAMPLE_ID=MMETSP0891 /ASSEMBLY_ACC=CAM_ASM_000534 /LENGTH=406 /DNA_ID=CAMNT_0042805055 /DNA_START=311 /DNA_END=1531 /DNA_ORIENTATION=-
MAAFPRVRIYLLLAVAMGFLDATTAVVKATVTDFGDGDTEGIAGSSRDHILARFCYFLIGKGTSTSSATRLTTELAVLHAHSGLGMISGLFLGELLYQFAGLRLAIACAGLILLPVLFAVIFKFPQPSEFDSFGIDNDSQGKANLITTSYQHKDKEEEAMTMKTNINTSAFFWQPALPNKRKFPFCLIVFAYVLVMFGIGGLSSVILYYAEDRAGLGSIDIALLILEAVLVTPLTAFLALRIIMPSLGLTRTNAFLTAASAAGSICVGLVPRHSIVLLIIFLTLFFVGYATFPLANGHLASQIPISSQGRFQGQLYALTVAFTLSGQELALKLYDYEPRAPFISTAIAGFTSSILFIIAGEIVSSITHDSDDDLYEGEEDEEQQHRKLLSDTSKNYLLDDRPNPTT